MPRSTSPPRVARRAAVGRPGGLPLRPADGERLEPTLAGLVDRLLASGEAHQLADLVDREALTGVVARALRTVPSSAAASALAELVAGAAHAGPGSG
ncbi:MAG: hypothetical protein R2731_02300 [Nocardioides sp.]